MAPQKSVHARAGHATQVQDVLETWTSSVRHGAQVQDALRTETQEPRRNCCDLQDVQRSCVVSFWISRPTTNTPHANAPSSALTYLKRRHRACPSQKKRASGRSSQHSDTNVCNLVCSSLCKVRKLRGIAEPGEGNTADPISCNASPSKFNKIAHSFLCLRKLQHRFQLLGSDLMRRLLWHWCRRRRRRRGR